MNETMRKILLTALYLLMVGCIAASAFFAGYQRGATDCNRFHQEVYNNISKQVARACGMTGSGLEPPVLIIPNITIT